jgi:hypothetical protein
LLDPLQQLLNPLLLLCQALIHFRSGRSAILCLSE